MFSRIPFFPVQASTLAADVDALYLFIVAVTAFFGILVTVVVIYFAAKYRTDDPMKVGARIHGSIPLELAWSVIPFLISIVIFVWAASVFFNLYRPPDQTLEIYATGKRWMWKFQHLDGQNEINELHVPVGRAIKVTFTSEDVLHSLFFPAFRTKADAIPGRYSSVWFTPTVLGEHHIFCAEYCGTNHSGMVGRVVVMEPTAYQAWLTGTVGGGSLAARGERLFSDLACNTCHLSDGSRPWTFAGQQVRRSRAARVRRHGPGRRSVSPRVHPQAAGQARGRLSAADADVPGTRQRRERHGSRGIREVTARFDRRGLESGSPQGTREPGAAPGEQVRPWTQR